MPRHTAPRHECPARGRGRFRPELRHIREGDRILVGRRATGTPLLDNLLPGCHLWLRGTGIDPLDGRRNQIMLTPAGRAALATGIPAARTITAEMLTGLTTGEGQRPLELLRRIA